MNHILKRACAILLSISLIFCWAAFADDSRAIAGSYANATFYRVQGVDRYETANEIAARGWDTASTVILASGTSYPDALAGAPLAYKLNAPILLVNGNSVPVSVMNRIYALGATNVYILGGSAAVSSSIENELRTKNFSVERIWGQNRYETAIRVAEKLCSLSSASGEAFVVSGENYPDALSVSPVAALRNAPIIYSNKKGEIDQNAASLLRSIGVSKAYVIGGTSAVGGSVTSNLRNCGVASITRISGASRYDTSLKVADYFINTFTTKAIAFATGENYPDALAGGVFAAKKGMPVLLTNSKLNADESSSIFLTASAYNESLDFLENLIVFIDKFGPEEVFVFGGQSALPNSTIDSYFAGDTWGGPSSTTTASTTAPTTAHQGYTVGGYVYESYEPVTSNYITKYGDPINDVKVAIIPYSTGDGIDAGNASTIYCKTNAYGFFYTTNLAPGQYYVRLSKEGYETSAYTLTVSENITNMKLFMYVDEHNYESETIIEGYVKLDSSMEVMGVSGAVVYLCDNGRVVGETVTDRNGYYSINVIAGNYLLYAEYETNENYVTDTYSVTAYEGKTVTCDLHLFVEETNIPSNPSGDGSGVISGSVTIKAYGAFGAGEAAYRGDVWIIAVPEGEGAYYTAEDLLGSSFRMREISITNSGSYSLTVPSGAYNLYTVAMTYDNGDFAGYIIADISDQIVVSNGGYVEYNIYGQNY